jgi:hypothetical protein
MVRLVTVTDEWVPSRYAYNDASDACRKARKVRGEVRTNFAVLVQGDPHCSLYSPADIHEALVSALVTERLGALPFFSAHLLSVNLPADQGKAVLQFRNLTSTQTLENMATESEQRAHESLSPTEPLRGELALLAAALAIGQQQLRLKHMDCHSGNVMWCPRPAQLERCIVPHLWGNGRHLAIPVPARIPAIIDFGLSTMQWTDAAGTCSVQRVDYHLLETDDNETDWGIYSPDLDGDEGYDLATFVESALCDLSDLRPQPLMCLRTLQKAHAALGELPLSREGRPLALVPTTMLEFLRAFCPSSWEVAEYTESAGTMVMHLCGSEASGAEASGNEASGAAEKTASEI